MLSRRKAVSREMISSIVRMLRSRTPGIASSAAALIEGTIADGSSEVLTTSSANIVRSCAIGRYASVRGAVSRLLW